MSDPSASSAEPGATPAPVMNHRLAVVLAAGTSAAVLVVELVALRLLAPYLGLTLETNTLVIGIALAAIAFGSWQGGRIADRIDPRTLIGPAMGVSGAVVALTPTILRTTGELAPPLLISAAMLTILVPGALLSAVVPMVTKLRLRDLDSTGSVVGQLSGWSTLGAIIGTVLTGFVLVSRLPVSVILLVLGVLLVGASLLWGLTQRPRRGPGTAAILLALGGGGVAVAVSPSGCDAETTYHCAQVIEDPDGSGGRTLLLDNLRHSFVDLDDPTRLEFAYVRGLATAIDTVHAEGEPLRAHHIGGGGLTVPRYLAATRPGTRSTVSEIDGGVVRLDRERLGLGEVEGVEVRVEDARLGLADVPRASQDLVVGDAFGGVSVPWHLTTREAVALIRDTLAPGGVYAVNLIDHGGQDFARAEVATLLEAFDHVALLGEPGDVGLAGAGDGGNVVAVASDTPLDHDALAAGLTDRRTPWQVSHGDALARWVGDAQVLTDDYAPVDQLLQAAPSLR